MISPLPVKFGSSGPPCVANSSRQAIAKRIRSPCVRASASGAGTPGSDQGGAGDTSDLNRGVNDDAESWKALQRRVRAVREKTVGRDRRCARNWRSGAYTTAVVAVSPDFVRQVDIDGSVLACGTAKGTVCLFCLATRSRVVFTNANRGQTTAVCVQGAFLASVGASDHTICVWDIGAYRRSFQWHTVRGEHTRTAEGLQLPPPLFRLEGHMDVVTSLKIDALGKLLYSSSVDGTIKVWDLTKGELLTTTRCGEPVLCMVVTGKSYVLVGCASGRVQAYLADKGLFLLAINCHAANTTALYFHDDTRTLATGDSMGHIKLWSFENSQCIGSFPGHAGAVMSIQIDATKVVSASRDGSVSVSAIDTKERLFSIVGFTKYISSCVFDGERLIADGTNNVIACHRFDVK